MLANNNKSKLLLIEQHRVGRSTFFTTPLFWDCECERGYIHPCTEGRCAVCSILQEDAPDARVDEVLNEKYGSSLPKGLLDALEEITLTVCPELIPIPF